MTTVVDCKRLETIARASRVGAEQGKRGQGLRLEGKEDAERAAAGFMTTTIEAAEAGAGRRSGIGSSGCGGG